MILIVQSAEIESSVFIKHDFYCMLMAKDSECQPSFPSVIFNVISPGCLQFSARISPVIQKVTL